MATIPSSQYGFFYNSKVGLKLKEDLPVAKLLPGQVLLKVEAAGLCHSDLHIIYEGLDCGDNYVMGHEIAGTIADALPGVDGQFSNLKVGDRVACFGANGCGNCEFCRTGKDNDCVNAYANWFGLGSDGGYQQYLLVRNPRNLVPIPENVEFAEAAAITDAVLTPYHAIRLANVTPVTKLLIIGAGGLGTNAIQLACAFGADVTVLDKKQKALDIAKKLDPQITAYTELPNDLPVAIFDVILDLVGIQATFDLAQKYVKSKGIIVPVGLGSPNLNFDLASLALREINIYGSFWGTSQDLAECFALAAQGKVKPQVHTVSLKELPTYIEKLRNGQYEGRVVLIP
ncbi:1-phenyl-1, 2-ethanediol dehydrogenase [Scheffersomyces amazonensis]|uniref:1-phenyl-1, 2-ethanediol dehydrogenase n=1 Tax=Scheffersomyces amazonensis TaxID=1078765 RepID=UPI00315D9AC3